MIKEEYNPKDSERFIEWQKSQNITFNSKDGVYLWRGMPFDREFFFEKFKEFSNKSLD